MTNASNINPSQTTRRGFVAAGAGLTTAAIAAIAAAEQAWADSNVAPAAGPIIKPGQTILFQGDSITDASRKKDDDAPNSAPALGKGYAWLAAAQLLVDRPDDNFKIFNRGISGNKVYQLAERWQKDCLDLKPDVLSILIGVNDYWHLKKHGYTGTLEVYESDYMALVKRTKAALPDVKLVICEPFILVDGAVDESWPAEFAGYQAAAKRVADANGAAFVPFQSMFNVASKIAKPTRWLTDGVHPAPDGAALMAHWWLKTAGA